MSDDGGNGNDGNQRAEEDPMDDACHVFGHKDAAGPIDDLSHQNEGQDDGQDDDAVEKKTHEVVRKLIIYMAKRHCVPLSIWLKDTLCR